MKSKREDKTPVDDNEIKDSAQLHQTVALGTIKELNKVIELLGQKAKIYAKKYVPDSKTGLAKLPIQLMLNNPHYYKNSKDFQKLLEPLTLDETLPPLNQQLDEKVLALTYSEEKSNKTLLHLSSAYSAINETRKMITQSETHPDTNLLDKTERTNISDVIAEMRAKRKKKILRFLAK